MQCHDGAVGQVESVITAAIEEQLKETLNVGALALPVLDTF